MFIMSETPARCNFKCEYCYVPDGHPNRNNHKTVTAEDYLKLARRFGDGPHLFWMCAIGETFMQPHIFECFEQLSVDHRIVAVSNLSYFGNDVPEQLRELPTTQHMGVYWSLHMNEMTKRDVLYKAMARAEKMLSAGVRIWPTIVCHPSYADAIPTAVQLTSDLGLKLIMCRYRVGGCGDIDDQFQEHIHETYREDSRVDFCLWSLTQYTKEVRGGICDAGVKQVIVDHDWNLCSCHGDMNKTVYGSFPEDIDNVPVVPVGRCASRNCPCKHSVMYGVNRKFPFTFANILVGWDSFMGKPL